MDDQRNDREGGGVKSRKLRIIAAVVAISFCIFFVLTLVKVQYDMVLTAYGRHRMTRSDAEELAASNYRWYRFLLTRVPDSEFLPEQNVTFQKTNAIARFKKIESIKVEWWFNCKNPVVCTIPESQWNAFASIFEHGIRDPNAVKRDSWGNLELVADGKTRYWPLLSISKNECGLFISQEELWRGIPTSAVDEFVKHCVMEEQPK